MENYINQDQRSEESKIDKEEEGAFGDRGHFFKIKEDDKEDEEEQKQITLPQQEKTDAKKKPRPPLH